MSFTLNEDLVDKWCKKTELHFYFWDSTGRPDYCNTGIPMIIMGNSGAMVGPLPATRRLQVRF